MDGQEWRARCLTAHRRATRAVTVTAKAQRAFAIKDGPDPAATNVC